MVLSIPHSGDFIPESISKTLNPEMVDGKDDADWFLPALYNFAQTLGIPVISANYHRWVVDLNRDPKGGQLYNDGRLITSVVPLTDFFGNELYVKGSEPDHLAITSRLEEYYYPYHTKLQEVLTNVKDKFGKVLLWDAHSIRREVPTLHPEPFPDFIIGTLSGKTCNDKFENIVFETLKENRFSVERNTIFKGGFITRNYGIPESGTFSLQLEMSKDLYMKNNEKDWDAERAVGISMIFETIFRKLFNDL